MANNRKPRRQPKQPVVIEHDPVPVAANAPVRQLFKVTIMYLGGRERVIENVFATVTETYTTDGSLPAVPYENYMIVQVNNRDSIYVNMDEVEELTVGVQTDG